MPNVLDTRVSVFVDDRFSRPLGTLERLLMRADERAVRLAASLKMADRAQETSAASFARRSRVYQLDDLSRRARSERQIVDIRARTGRQLERLEAQHLQRRAQLAARVAGAQATQAERAGLIGAMAGSPYGPRPEDLAAYQTATSAVARGQRAIATEQAEFDTARIDARERLNELETRGQREAESSLLRQQELLSRQQIIVGRQTAQRERILARQRDLERTTSSRRYGALALGAGAVGVAADFATMHLIRGATPAEMGQVGGLVRQISGVTMFSVPQIYQQLSEMFGAGIATAAGAKRPIQPLEALAPIFSRAAEDLYFVSGGRTDPLETIRTLSEISHQYGAYTPEKMAPMVDRLVKLSQILPGQNLQTLSTMGGYIVPMLSGMLGVPSDLIMAMEAAGIQRYGAGSVGARGAFSGASLSRLFTQALHLSKKGTTALAAMGMLSGGMPNFLDSSGHLDLMHFISDLQTFRGRMESNPGQRQAAARALGLPGGSAPTAIEAAAYNMAFNAAGARPAMALADPRFVMSMENIQKALPGLLGAIALQQQLLGLANEQTQRLATNFGTLEADIGARLIPKFQSLTSSTADLLSRWDQIMRGHPAAATATAYGVAGPGAAGTYVGATWLVRKALSTVGFEGAAEAFGRLSGQAFLVAVGLEFNLKMASWGSDLGKAIGSGLMHLFSPGTHPAGAPLPALDPHAWGHLSPAARTAFEVKPLPGSEALPAHGGDHIEIHHLEVHYDKASAADAEKLIMDLRRAVRTTGASTGAASPESKGVHGFPIR